MRTNVRIHYIEALQPLYKESHLEAFYRILNAFFYGNITCLGVGGFAWVGTDAIDYGESQWSVPYLMGYTGSQPLDSESLERTPYDTKCVLKAGYAPDGTPCPLGKPYKSAEEATRVAKRTVDYSRELVREGLPHYPILVSSVIETEQGIFIFSLCARVKGQDDKAAILSGTADAVHLLAYCCALIEECSDVNCRRKRQGKPVIGLDGTAPNLACGYLFDYLPAYLGFYIEPGGTRQEATWRSQRIYRPRGQMMAALASYVELQPDKVADLSDMVTKRYAGRTQYPSIQHLVESGPPFVFLRATSHAKRRSMMAEASLGNLLHASHIQVRLLVVLALAQAYPDRSDFEREYNPFRPWLTTHSVVPIPTKRRAEAISRLLLERIKK